MPRGPIANLADSGGDLGAPKAAFGDLWGPQMVPKRVPIFIQNGASPPGTRFGRQRGRFGGKRDQKGTPNGLKVVQNSSRMVPKRPPD